MRIAIALALFGFVVSVAPAAAQPPGIKRQPGIQTPVPLAPGREVTPSPMKVLTPPQPAKSREIIGVDYRAHVPAGREIGGIDYIAHAPGTREITGIDYVSRTPGTREITGINYVSRTPGTREITGVDFVTR